MYKHLTYTAVKGVATVGMNRPESLNALDVELLQELSDCFSNCQDDPEVKAVILKGEGNSFCAGGNIKSMKQASSRPHLLRTTTLHAHSVTSTIWRMPKPVIAAVHGSVTGAGFALALACDLIIAAEGTRFGTAYLAIGLSPDGGTTFLLPKVMGLQRAKYLTFMSEIIDVSTGQQLGFVSRVVKREELANEACKIAEKLAEGPTWAIIKTKELFNRSYSQDLETQLEAERRGIVFCSGTQDFDEGLNAFFAKRPPKYRGA
jgi:2-(1,2-epoxy-1,2-dihydrophenyl)acetyl-CoA isomerase